MALPTLSVRTSLEKALRDLIEAIEGHELWTPPSPHKTLYWCWDFVKRSHYMLSEFENIRLGKPLQHPEQFRPSPGTGDRAAVKVYDDVCSRTMMTELLINDKTGRTAMLTGVSGTPVDFGLKCKEALENLKKATSEEATMAGASQ